MADPVITWADVLNVAPELASTPAPMQTAVLTAVGDQVPLLMWPQGQANAQAWLAAHLVTISRKRGDGPKTSQSTGPVSQSLASMIQFGQLGLTSYGVEYQRLVRMNPSVAFGAVF